MTRSKHVTAEFDLILVTEMSPESKSETAQLQNYGVTGTSGRKAVLLSIQSFWRDKHFVVLGYFH